MSEKASMEEIKVDENNNSKDLSSDSINITIRPKLRRSSQVDQTTKSHQIIR